MKYLLSYIIICACMVNPDVGYAQTVIQEHNGKLNVIQLGQPNGTYIIGNQVVQQRVPIFIPPPIYTPPPRNHNNPRRSCEYNGKCLPNYGVDLD